MIIGLLRRWSTPNQTGNFRQEAHFEVMEKVVAAKGWEFAYYDEGQVSGRDMKKRPNLQRLLDDIRHKKVQGIGALDIDRITRDEYLVDPGIILSACADAGAIIVTRDRVYDPRKKNDRFIFQVQSAIAGNEVSTIRERMYEGLSRKMMESPVHRGRTPWGYMRVLDGVDAKGNAIRHLEKDPELTPVVMRLFELASTSLSVQGVSAQLNGEGLLKRRWKDTEGGPRFWTHADVASIVFNPIYSGRHHVLKHPTKPIWESDVIPEGLRDKVHYIEDWAFLDPEDHDALMRRFEKTKAHGTRGRRNDNALLGILSCLYCGGKMYFSKRKPGSKLNDFHFCFNHMACKTSCRGQTISDHLVKAAVFDFIQGRLSKSLVEEVANEHQDIFGSGAEEELRSLRLQLATLEEKRMRFKQMARAATSEALEQTYTENAAELLDEIASVRETLRQKETFAKNKDRMLSVVENVVRFRDVMEHADSATQHGLLTHVFRWVKVEAYGAMQHRQVRVAAWHLMGEEEPQTSYLTDDAISPYNVAIWMMPPGVWRDVVGMFTA